MGGRVSNASKRAPRLGETVEVEEHQQNISIQVCQQRNARRSLGRNPRCEALFSTISQSDDGDTADVFCENAEASNNQPANHYSGQIENRQSQEFIEQVYSEEKIVVNNNDIMQQNQADRTMEIEILDTYDAVDDGTRCSSHWELGPQLASVASSFNANNIKQTLAEMNQGKDRIVSISGHAFTRTQRPRSGNCSPEQHNRLIASVVDSQLF